MLWTIFVILVVLWLLGLVTSYTLGGFVHILLVLAVIVLVIRLLQGRRVACVRRRKYENDSWLGILLIVVGALVLAYQGINYTREKKVVDMGSLHVTKEDSRANSPASNTRRAGIGWRSRPAGHGGKEQVVAHSGARSCCVFNPLAQTGLTLKSRVWGHERKGEFRCYC